MAKQLAVQSAYFSRRSACAVVVGDIETLDKLVEYMSPYFARKELTNDDACVPTIYAGIENAPISLPSEVAVVSCPGEPDRRVLHLPPAMVFVVDQPPGLWRVIHVGRVLRSVLRWQLFSSGATYFHAGMVEMRGQGVAYVGPKRAGKTSCVLAALVNDGVRYVANDDLAVAVERGVAVGLGWPRSISIRRDTVNQLAHLLPGLVNAQSLRPQPLLAEQPVLLFPSEIAAVTNRSILAEVPLRLVVFPEFVDPSSGRCSFERLSPADAADRLRKNLFPIPDDRDSYLCDYFKQPNPERTETCITTLVGHLPCIRLRQSTLDLVGGAEKIMRLLE
jgi:hypothetical protein